MTFNLRFSHEAKIQFEKLQKKKSSLPAFKSVRKILALMETNLKHPSLQTHIYQSNKGPRGEKVFESYAQNKTPCAYRIFWYYGPEKERITIAAILPHP